MSDQLTCTVKKSSWHYWLATTGNSNPISAWDEIDSCGYVRRVIFNTILMLLGAFGAIALTASFFYGAYAVLMMILGTMDKFPPQGMAFIIVTVVAAAVGAVMGGGRVNEMLRERRASMEPSPPGFLSKAWTSFKNKTCFKVEFTD